ncbi:MAG: hypothetical protein J7599_23645 [Niabella sp.]|nr:hypothetical protein [Niabella sp.]
MIYFVVFQEPGLVRICETYPQICFNHIVYTGVAVYLVVGPLPAAIASILLGSVGGLPVGVSSLVSAVI